MTDTPIEPERPQEPRTPLSRPESRNTPRSRPSGPHSPQGGASTADASPPPRTNTPDRRNDDGSTTITMKRACNGCGTRLGDVTEQEMARGINGLPLPDVRSECPTCAPTAPKPACRPMQILAGDALCLDLDCDHDLKDGTEHCVEVTTETVCGTHSELSNLGEVLHAEPWPCTRAAASA